MTKTVRTMLLSTAIVSAMSLILLRLCAGGTSVTPTVEFDPSLQFVELKDYKFHVRTFDDKSRPPLVVVNGGPGGYSEYLYPIQGLAKDNYIIFDDQCGTGLSPRINREPLKLKSSLEDLHFDIRLGGLAMIFTTAMVTALWDSTTLARYQSD